MKSPETALIWYFWRQCRSEVNFGLAMMLFAWAVCLFLPWLASKWSFQFAVAIGWIAVILPSRLITSHHFGLPISSWRLAGVTSLFTVVLVSSLSGISLIGIMLLGRASVSFELCLLAASLSMFALWVGTILPFENERSGIDEFVVIGGGMFAVVLGLISARLESVAVLPVSTRLLTIIGSALVCYLLTWHFVHARRKGRTRLGERLNHLATKGIDLRFNRLTTPRDPLDATIQLDWRRFQEVIIVLGALVVVTLPMIAYAVDIRGAFLAAFVVGVMFIPMSGLASLGMNEFEKKQNGSFRWTLPISDQTMAKSMIKNVFRVNLTIWSLWIVVLGMIALASWFMSEPLFDHNNRFADAPIAKKILIAVLFGPGVFVAGWVISSMGIVHAIFGNNYVWDIVRRTIGLVILCLLTVYLSPSEFNRLVFELTILIMGAWMVKKTFAVFQVADEQHIFSINTVRSFLAIWLLAALGIVILATYYSIGFGLPAFGIGILALAIHPFASIPLACRMRRHHSWAYEY